MTMCELYFTIFSYYKSDFTQVLESSEHSLLCHVCLHQLVINFCLLNMYGKVSIGRNQIIVFNLGLIKFNNIAKCLQI